MMWFFVTKTLCGILWAYIFSVSFVSADNLCINEETSCHCILKNGSSFDLTSVGLPNFPRFYEIPGPVNKSNKTDSIYQYSYNPCYAFNFPDTYTDGSCIGVAACRKSPGGSEGQLPHLDSLALQTQAVFYHDETITYINYSYPASSLTLMVELKCSEKVPNSLTVDDEDKETIIMTLESQCACLDKCKIPTPDGEKANLSTGSILLITFFTILIIYFIFGIGWNFCNGAKGIEMLPNIEFWNDLPKLIMEGIAFTCSCCTKKGYGDI